MEDNFEAYHYAQLIAKYLRGELSAIEEDELNAWINEKPENALLVKTLQQQEMIKSDLDFFAAIKTEDAWQNIITQKASLANKVYAFIKKWKYAAVILVLLSATAILYKNSKSAINQPAVVSAKNKYKNDVAPATDKAKLTLNDGSVIVMDNRTAGLVKSYAGLKVIAEHGTVSFEQTGINNSFSKEQYNTICIPTGCKYKIRLADGSMVWLNSSSSLKFPLAFNKLERKVYLTGEAYFEVAKDKFKPFKVFLNNTVVKVLGTHFNIHAYADEEMVKTTLLEGSVKIYRKGDSKIITPGQQAYITRNSSKITINSIDVSESVAWKNNLFIFDREDIYSVMKEVARWYNVDVEYKEEVPHTHISGSISRKNNISQILNMLELTGGVHFSIDGRRVIVTR